MIGLISIALVAVGLHLWGIRADLPYEPDVDEPIFVRAAVGMIEHRSLDPGWFGNPGSTVIYPLAALIELWYLIAKHVPPFAHPMPAIGREFAADPTPFYLIGRLVSATYGIACVGVTWLLARRLVGDAGGLVAAALLPATALLVAYGQLVRTDTAGLFFTLLTLWLSLRALDGSRSWAWAWAAIALGLAVSTRWFLAMLVVPYAVAGWIWMRTPPAGSADRRRRRGWQAPIVALIWAPVAFALTSPFVFVDLPRVVDDLRFEARTVHPGADGLSPIGNLAWYLVEIVPATFGLALLAVAAIGFVVVGRRHRGPTTVLAAFAIAYLLGVSASPLHWDRYVIPLVPIVGVFVAGAVRWIASLVGSAVIGGPAPWRRESRPAGPDGAPGIRRRRWTAAVASAIVILLLAPPLMQVVAADRLRAAPSTRIVASVWIQEHLPRGSRIAEEMYTAYLGAGEYDVLRVFALAERPLDAYRHDGYRFVISSSAIADRYRDETRYPVEAAFYRSLMAGETTVATFEPGPDRAGPVISIYELSSP